VLTTAEQILGNTVGDVPEAGERPRRAENNAGLPKREPVKNGDSDGKIDNALSTDSPRVFGRQKNFRILVVSSCADHYKSLRHILRRFGWKMHRVNTCRDAEIFLSENLVAVLISDCTLPDGGWKDILGALSSASCAPALIVASHLADDRSWAEVLNLGGYDLLIKPFNLKEASRVISMASSRVAFSRTT
jgi:response regulator RpfG family c-di-GMP phosphodiesterase